MKKIVILTIVILLGLQAGALARDYYRLKSDSEVNFNPYVNSVGFAAGYTIAADKLSGFNAGVNYMIKKKRSETGLGFFFNALFAENFEYSFGFPLTSHNFWGLNNLTVLVAPGLTNTKNVSYVVKDDKFTLPNDYLLSTPENRLNFMLRLGVEYEFKLPNEMENKFTIYPFFYDDIVSFVRNYYTFGIKTSINF